MDDQVRDALAPNYYFKRKWQLFVTFFCLFTFITAGLHLEISGSTMLQLSILVGTNLAKLSWIVAARSFGYLLTVLTFGLVFRSVTKNHCELMLTVGYVLPAAATISTPYVQSLWPLCLALLLQGISQAISDLAINTLVTKIWLYRSTPALNCVYLGYPIGALLSLFIVRSFRGEHSLTNRSTEKQNSTIMMSENVAQFELIGPYTIASLFCLTSAIGFACIAYKQRSGQTGINEDHPVKSNIKEEMDQKIETNKMLNRKRFWEACSPTTCGQGMFFYGFFTMFLLLLFNFFFGGIEQGFTKFFVSFVEQEQIDANPRNALYSMIFYWLPMLLGRIICTLLTAFWISPSLALTLSMLLCFMTYLLWIGFIWFIGLSPLSVYTLVTLNGFSISPISPTIVGWMKQFLALCPVELSLFLSANAAGGIIFGFMCGYVFEYYNRKHLFTILIIAVLICLILFSVLLVFQRIHSYRKNNVQTTVVDNEEDKSLERFLNDNSK